MPVFTTHGADITDLTVVKYTPAKPAGRFGDAKDEKYNVVPAFAFMLGQPDNVTSNSTFATVFSALADNPLWNAIHERVKALTGEKNALLKLDTTTGEIGVSTNEFKDDPKKACRPDGTPGQSPDTQFVGNVTLTDLTKVDPECASTPVQVLCQMSQDWVLLGLPVYMSGFVQNPTDSHDLRLFAYVKLAQHSKALDTWEVDATANLGERAAVVMVAMSSVRNMTPMIAATVAALPNTGANLAKYAKKAKFTRAMKLQSGGSVGLCREDDSSILELRADKVRLGGGLESIDMDD